MERQREVAVPESLDVLGEASDGEAAVHAACRLAPALVILDYVLPGEDGMAVLRRIRAGIMRALGIHRTTALVVYPLRHGLVDLADAPGQVPLRPDSLSCRVDQSPMDLEAQFGGIDIYLFDQILRRRIGPDDRIVDAGCGMGRNLVYFLREGYEVYAADADPDCIREVRMLAARLAPGLPEANFHLEPLERLTFPDGWASVVISSAVLHFARDDKEFDAMLRGSWRVLASGGVFFCRLASTIGLESRVERVGTEGRRYRLPDGTTRYLVDEAMLMGLTRDLGGRLLDPLKTTVVQDQRSMTTWVVRKD